MTTAKILFFDTETSGFIKKALSYDDPEQAWLVQIGAILSDNEGNVIDEINCLIRANGREINYHAEKIHGFSAEKTELDGIEELSAAEQFGLLLAQVDKIVCHNFDFDWKYVYQLMQRNIEELSDDARAAFYVNRDSQCTMKDKRVIKFCGLKNKNGRAKWPKLIELHEILFDCGFDGAHDAMADITATKDCYFELIERGVI